MTSNPVLAKQVTCWITSPYFGAPTNTARWLTELKPGYFMKILEIKPKSGQNNDLKIGRLSTRFLGWFFSGLVNQPRFDL